ncbi:MAG: hypothetical protein JW892_07315 [Anaerolineae bacterium]|nr:hypothetical protein [Anaerolineae bacterium]
MGLQPAVVFPCHDPDGVLLLRLESILPQLRALFASAFMSVTESTVVAQSQSLARLQNDAFLSVNVTPHDTPIGVQFYNLYRRAANSCPVNQVLHLCFPDRLVYALLGPHRETFCADMRAVMDTPLLFQRSAAAWATHPRNYYVAENLLTQLGEMILGRSLDFSWCHLALTAQQLKEILPYLKAHDLAILCEMVLALRQSLRMCDVDWLAWEDPLILGRELEQLKCERELSAAETRKRLAYVEPMLKVLFDFARQLEEER